MTRCWSTRNLQQPAFFIIFHNSDLFGVKAERFRANLKLRKASHPVCCKPLRSPPWYVCECQQHPSHIDSLRTCPALSGWCLNLAHWTAIHQRIATRARSDARARGFYFCLQTTPDAARLRLLCSLLGNCPNAQNGKPRKSACYQWKVIEGHYSTEGWHRLTSEKGSGRKAKALTTTRTTKKKKAT